MECQVFFLNFTKTNLWRQTSANNIIGACHALDTIAREIGVGQIGAEEHCFARLQIDVIQKVNVKQSHVAGVLFIQR